MSTRKYLECVPMICLLIWQNTIYADGFKGRQWGTFEPVGAREAAMGVASVALVDGACTVLTNPGAVIFSNEFDLTYFLNPFYSYNDGGNMTQDVDIQYLAFSSRISSRFSISLFRLRTDLSRRIFGSYSYNGKIADKSSGVSLNWMPIKGLGIGASGKLLTQSYEASYVVSSQSSESFEGKINEEHTSWALDLGFLYQMERDIRYSSDLIVNVGGTVSNLFSRGYFKGVESLEDESPVVGTLGYSVNYRWNRDISDVSPIGLSHNFEYRYILNLDDSKETLSNSTTGIGFELLAYEMASVRIGYFNGFENFYDSNGKLLRRAGVTYGFGLILPFQRIFGRIPIALKYDFARYPGFENSNHANEQFEIQSAHISYNF